MLNQAFYYHFNIKRIQEYTVTTRFTDSSALVQESYAVAVLLGGNAFVGWDKTKVVTWRLSRNEVVAKATGSL